MSQDALTDREQEILACLVERLSNHEIAARLHLAHRTVKWYNSQIYSKLGVSSREEAVEQAQAQGLLPESSPAESQPVARNNLPTQTTMFIGRRQELAEIADLLADQEVRLLTILAPGGMGKTRLGLAAAERQLRHFTGGVFFVPLAPLSNPDDLVTTIAENVGFSFYGDDPPKHQLLDYLRERNALLVLDNFEHLLEGAPLVTDILQAAPQVKVLATSREKLNLRGEAVFTLSGLDFPTWETPEDALEYDAVRLFMQGAHLARPDFELQADDLDYLARICRLTAGMPLGIVLAAGWVDMLSLEQVSDELQRGIDILETEQRDVPGRQRSVRATFNYSWERLTEAEQAVFRKLSVFCGGFTSEASEAVAGANLRQLRKLVDKALVGVSPNGRYEVHELLRQYAEEKLREAGKTDAIVAAHTGYFADFMQKRGEDIKGRRQLEGLNEIEADFDNVRAAWGHAIEQGDYQSLDRMAECLVLFCEMHVRYQEGEDLFQRAVEAFRAGQDDGQHPALNRLRLGWIRAWLLQERHSIPEPIQEQLAWCLEFARQQDDQMTLAWCLWVQGEFERVSFSFEAALGPYEQALARFRKLDNAYGVGRVLRGITNCSMFIDNWQQFTAYNQQHLDWTRAIGDRAGMAHALFYSASTPSREGNLAEEASLRHEAAALWRETGDRKSLGFAIAGLALHDLLRGQWARARQTAEQVIAIGSDTNFTILNHSGLRTLGFMAVVKGDYEAGERLGNEASAYLPSYSQDDPFIECLLCIAALGLDDAEQARRRLVRGLQYLSQDYWRPGAVLWLAIAVPVLARADRTARAAEVLGLVRAQPEEIVGWLAHWQLLADLQRDLEAELGADVYAAAFERGAQLDLKTVVEEFLAEFGNES